MEEKQSPAPNGAGKPHPLTALVLMEIGILEIGIAIIVFLGIFGTLNYFNILPVSETFPKFLGWLPKQRVKSNNNIYNDLLKQYSSPLPTPTPYISLETTVRKNVNRLLPTIFNKSFLPSEISKINLNQDSFNEANFFISWINKESVISGILTVSPKIDSILSLFVSIDQPILTPLSSTLATTITSPLFAIQPEGLWKCSVLSNTKYCENFWKEATGGKKGLIISRTIQPINGKIISSISFCERNQNSDFYSWNSCIREFSNTGIADNLTAP